MKRRISCARACVEVLQSFSSQVFTGGRLPLVLAVSVRLGAHKESRLGAAWSGRSLPTCLRSWQARLAAYLTRRLAASGLQLETAIMMRIRIIKRSHGGGFSPHRLYEEPLLYTAPYKRALFVRGVMNQYFSVGTSKQEEELMWLPRQSGSSGISGCVQFFGEEDSTSPPRCL
jgi:hypothetical protein